MAYVFKWHIFVEMMCVSVSYRRGVMLGLLGFVNVMSCCTNGKNGIEMIDLSL